MVFGFGTNGGSCDVNTLEQIMNNIRTKQAQLQYLQQQDSINPQEYERMKSQIQHELSRELESLAACLRTIPKDPSKLSEQVIGFKV